MSYYHGLISSRRANSLLSQRPDGSFLIRDSQSQPGNFVLSAKYLGRMYHVLIFQQGGKYVLDSATNDSSSGGVDEAVQFKSLEELVQFLTGHNLKVGEEDVQLTETCPCPDDSFRISSNTVSRVMDSDDSDVMTDVFATLFGKRSVVVCVAHSSTSIDGRPEGPSRAYWVALVKDVEQKGYFIRIVDKESKEVAREKKVGKQFQYDLPEDLLMTFLSDQGITCIGFRDTQEKDRFVHQVDRVVRLQLERSVKLRGRADSGTATAKRRPTEITHRIKASEFDVENMSEEWQYLFRQAGVTQDMLKDKASLQFILDTVVLEIGGAPQKLTHTATDKSGGSEQDPAVLEREAAITVHDNVRKESLRASLLSDLLHEGLSLLQNPAPQPAVSTNTNICPYLSLCERYKDHLVVKHSMIALAPEQARCCCGVCAGEEQVMCVAGNPPQQYTLPLGWAQFMHSSQTHALADYVPKSWHVAYSCVPPGRVALVMKSGQLLDATPTSQGEFLLSDAGMEQVVKLSPDIDYASVIASLPPQGFHDKESGEYYLVQTAFQVFIQPGTYTVHMDDKEGGVANSSSPTPHPRLATEWHARERTYIIHSLWIHMKKAD